MHAVVGDELGRCHRGHSRALRVDEGIVVVDVRQQSGAGLHAVFARQSQVGDCGAVLRIVQAGPLQGILQRDGHRRATLRARIHTRMVRIRDFDLCKTRRRSQQNQNENPADSVGADLGCDMFCPPRVGWD